VSNSILWALIGQTGIVLAGVVVILSFNHARFAGLDKRIDDLLSEMNARFDDLKDLLRSEIKRLEDRLDRLEHAVAKP
jgi:formiminotetrahydrofolate cyclodeaminase